MQPNLAACGARRRSRCGSCLVGARAARPVAGDTCPKRTSELAPRGGEACERLHGISASGRAAVNRLDAGRRESWDVHTCMDICMDSSRRPASLRQARLPRARAAAACRRRRRRALPAAAKSHLGRTARARRPPRPDRAA
eukprot:6232743-Prymnesium_polylepis.1